MRLVSGAPPVPRGWNASVDAERDYVHVIGRNAEISAYIAFRGFGDGDDRARFAGDPGLHSHEPVPAALGKGRKAVAALEIDALVHAYRVVDARYEREADPGDAEQAVAEPLVVVDDVEVVLAAFQLAERPDAKGEGLGEAAGPHGRGLDRVGPVAVLVQARGVKRVVVPVQVQAGDLPQHRSGVQVGVGLTGEHLDVVSLCGQFPAEVPYVDALAAAVRFASVGQQGHAERTAHAGQRGSPPSSGFQEHPAL